MSDAATPVGRSRLLSAVETSSSLAPIGGRAADPDRTPVSLPSRLWSRVRYVATLLFTARQKQFNLEVTAAVRELVRAAEIDRTVEAARADQLQAEVAELRAAAATRREVAALDERLRAAEEKFPMFHGRQQAWRFTTRREFEAACESWVGATSMGDGVVLARVLGCQLMLLQPRDLNIAGWILSCGFWEAWISVVMARHVRPGWRVADVGANAGYYTLLLAQLVGPTGTVLACEPNPDLAPLLVRSVGLNGLGWVTVFQGAVADREGTANLIVPASGALNGTIVSDGPCGVPVPVRTLDDLAPNPIDFVKIDVEGAEELVWNGMAGLRSRSPGIIVLIEFNTIRVNDPRAFLDRITGEGFTLRYVDYNADLVPVTAERLLSERVGEDWMLWLAR